jgi:hypothetical protein
MQQYRIKGSKVFGAVLAVFATLLSPLCNHVALSYCYYPNDGSTVVGVFDCQSTEWELQATVMDDQGCQTKWDLGDSFGWGECLGNYYACSCTWVPPSSKAPTITMNVMSDFEGSYTVWWNINGYYQPTYDTCTPGCNGCNDACDFTRNVEHENPYNSSGNGYSSISCDCAP